nr:FAD:protein FMN transferase [uncultured Actinoplanes sp.]
MPLVETLPITADTAQWTVWGTTARIVVTDPGRLAEAVALVRGELAAVDAACSRFRADSELRKAGRARGRPVRVSPLLATLVEVALKAAAETGGDVDPTVGAIMCDLGYDRDYREIAGAGSDVRLYPAPDWRAVTLDGRLLTVPGGVLLDLGATAKALTADRAAGRIADRLGIGALVALGGDIATAGPGPAGGWRVRVQDRPGDPHCTVALPAGAALATSSTASRTWGANLHHIVDPRTGNPARAVWRTVSVAACSCVRANTLSTAAIVRGHRAVDLLRNTPSRLVTPALDVLRLGGWPA